MLAELETPEKTHSSFIKILILYITVASAYLLSKGFYSLDAAYHSDHPELGNLAHALLHERILPVWFYSMPVWSHGPIVLSPFILIAFFIFGETNLALRAVAVFLTLGTCLGYVHLANRYENRRLAYLAGIAFIFTPRIWWDLSVTLWGIHMESCFFGMLQFVALLYVLEKRMTWKSAAVLGALSGLGTLASLHNITVILTLLVFWLVHQGARNFFRTVWVYGFFALLFYLPSILYNLLNGINYGYYRNIAAPVPEGRSVIGAFFLKVAEKASDLFTIVLPNSPSFYTPYKSHLYMTLVAAGFLLVVVGLLRQYRSRETAPFVEKIAGVFREKPLAALAVLFPTVYVVLYTAGPMGIPYPKNEFYYRYLITLFPFFFLFIAYLFEKFAKAGIVLAMIALSTILVHEILPFPLSLAYSKIRPVEHYRMINHQVKGYNLWKIYFVSVPLYLGTLEPQDRLSAFSQLVDQVPDEEKGFLVYSMGRLYEHRFLGDEFDWPQVRSMFDAAHLHQIAQSIGYGYGSGRADAQDDSVVFDFAKSLQDYFQVDNPAQAGDLAVSFVQGIGWGVGEAMDQPIGIRNTVQAAALKPFTDAKKYPIDQITREIAVRRIQNARKMLESLPVSLWPEFFFGVGISAGYPMDNNDATAFHRFMELLIGEESRIYHDDLVKGFGYGIGFHLANAYTQLPAAKLDELLVRFVDDKTLPMIGPQRFMENWNLTLVNDVGKYRDVRIEPATVTRR